MMQCSPAFYDSRYPIHFGQIRPCNPSFQQVPQSSIYPEILGEGEVVSVIYPDGSVHLYFIPLNKRQEAPYWHPYHNSYGNNNTMGAYYVRSISNPITPAVFHQQCQKMYAGPYSSPCFISESLNIPSPGFQLKFHNDCWTSTTDLHYFFPRKHRCDWFPSSQPNGSAAVQVDIPVKERSLDLQEESTKPCLCSQGEDKNMSGTDSVDECLCIKCNSDASSIKSKRKRKCKARQEKQKLAMKKSDVVCECHEASTSNKSMATYTEQASGCAASNERNTQTCPPASSAASSFSGVKSSVMNKSDVKTELWLPKTSLSGKAMTTKSSENILGVFESTHSSATCCCSEVEGN